MTSMCRSSSRAAERGVRDAASRASPWLGEFLGFEPARGGYVRVSRSAKQQKENGTMPRILVLADCSAEFGDRPVMLDEDVNTRSLHDPSGASDLYERVSSAVAHAHEVERRVSALYAR
jgi:hypothetical protein